MHRLEEKYPNATYELNWKTPEEMLVGTILAAKSTDEKINQITPKLFKKYPTPEAFAYGNTTTLETDLKSTGFYKQKAKTIQTVFQAIVEKFGGKVPQTMEELTSITGIARKTANVVLNCCFNIPSGIIVDTHVARVSQRLGLSESQKPEKIEKDLMKLIPQKNWTFWGPAMVLHGRYTCKAKSPNCHECIFLDLCPQNGVEILEDIQLKEIKSEDIPLENTPKNTQENISKNNPKNLENINFKPNSIPISSNSEEKQGNPKPNSKPNSKSINPNNNLDKSNNMIQLEGWKPYLEDEINQSYFQDLGEFIKQERHKHQIFPPKGEVFTAFELTPFDKLKVVILGQDPYHDDNQAHGLSFSVKKGVKLPPSLRNIFQELSDDLGIKPANHGDLTHWAKQGVLMLNAVLTVEAHKANSHKDIGWEKFTDAVIKTINDNKTNIVFVLWGRYAQKKGKIIDKKKHTIIASAHPSPFSARNGFFGSKPFSQINKALQDANIEEIDWRLPE